MSGRVQRIDQCTKLQRQIIKVLNDNPRATYKTVAAKCNSTPAYVSDIAHRFSLDRWGKKDISLDVDALVERYTDDQFSDLETLHENSAEYQQALQAAADIRTDPITLDALSKSGVEAIQLAVSKNLGAPQSAVDYLADHPNVDIAHQAVADVSIEQLSRYVNHPSPRIRLSVLLHHECPREVRETALDDPDDDVRRMAESMLRVSEYTQIRT